MKIQLTILIFIFCPIVKGQDSSECFIWSHRLPNSTSIFGLNIRLPFGSFRSTKTICLKSDSSFYYKYGIDLIRSAEGTFKREGEILILQYRTSIYQIYDLNINSSGEKVPIKLINDESNDWPSQIKTGRNKIYIIKTLSGEYKRPLKLKKI
jgi:hypothetical protein